MALPGLARSLIVSAALLGFAVEAAAEQIVWYKDLKQARAAAEKAGLPMFIDFWAEWCAACKAMDEHVYTNPNVIAVFRSKIIGVRLHFDLHRDLARTYNAGALPHLVFTNSLGMPLVAHRGFLDAADLASVVNALPPIGEINRLDRQLRQNRDSFADLLAMARVLRASGFFETSAAYYDRASKHAGARADAALRQVILYESALSVLELRDGVRAAALLEQAFKQRPSTVGDADFLLALGRAHVLTGRHDKARQALETLLRHYPQSPAAGKARSMPALREVLQPDRRPR
jgi:thioredoxin-like negative regulator of GroEL